MDTLYDRGAERSYKLKIWQSLVSSSTNAEKLVVNGAESRF
jgi:hypothetical protein